MVRRECTKDRHSMLFGQLIIKPFTLFLFFLESSNLPLLSLFLFFFLPSLSSLLLFDRSRFLSLFSFLTSLTGGGGGDIVRSTSGCVAGGGGSFLTTTFLVSLMESSSPDAAESLLSLSCTSGTRIVG